MRKALAGLLIRLAHRVYPPRVTHHGRDGSSWIIRGAPRGKSGSVRLGADSAIYTAGPMGPAMQAEYERRESRGWGN